MESLVQTFSAIKSLQMSKQNGHVSSDKSQIFSAWTIEQFCEYFLSHFWLHLKFSNVDNSIPVNHFKTVQILNECIAQKQQLKKKESGLVAEQAVITFCLPGTIFFIDLVNYFVKRWLAWALAHWTDKAWFRHRSTRAEPYWWIKYGKRAVSELVPAYRTGIYHSWAEVVQSWVKISQW